MLLRPLAGRRLNGRMRLPILFPLAENPPTRFRQMPGHRHGRFAVALFRFHPIVKPQGMLACVALAMHRNTRISPAEEPDSCGVEALWKLGWGAGQRSAREKAAVAPMPSHGQTTRPISRGVAAAL